jgi:hypothetical protein|tara:strand:+ start:733 stop:1101 length:369 start_codon:yes stop_codon:yes gene_type:complete
MSGEYERQAFLSGPWLHRAMDQIMRNSQDDVRRSVGIGVIPDPNFQLPILATHTFSFLARHTTATIANAKNPIKTSGPQSSSNQCPIPNTNRSCIFNISLVLSNKKHKVARSQAFACASKYK